MVHSDVKVLLCSLEDAHPLDNFLCLKNTAVQKPELNLCLREPGLATDGSLGQDWGLTFTLGVTSVSALRALARMNILEP